MIWFVRTTAPFCWYFTAQSTQSTSFTQLDSIQVYYPEYSEGRYIEAWFDAKVDAGTGTFRLYDSVAASAGTEIEVTATSYTSSGASRLEVASGWGGTRRALHVQGKIDNGANTFFLLSTDRVSIRFND